MKAAASIVLPPLSAVYRAATRFRLTAYRRGWLSTAKLARPVISVGNLTTGGTGKTPLVDWVCRAIAASANDRRVCVLTRGYGRANPNSQVVVSSGSEILAREREAGDEPFLLAQNLIGIAAVIANPNRVAAGEWAIENLRSDVFVLDDGFQHLRLARDLDIVTIDATNPFGGGSLLPYGRLREPTPGLARAGCVVITRTELVDDWIGTRDAVRQVAEGVPIFSSRMATAGIRRLDGETLDAIQLHSQPLAAFCGVGNPKSFFDHLRREKFSLAFTRAFADHHHYTQSDLNTLIAQAKASGAVGLITTAKDAIKLTAFSVDLPIYVLEIQISIAEEDQLSKMIHDACHNRAR